jgi:uncharacterized membrane protein YkvA (DUF1232 family)
MTQWDDNGMVDPGIDVKEMIARVAPHDLVIVFYGFKEVGRSGMARGDDRTSASEQRLNPGLIARWKGQARTLKQEGHALYLAYRDPRTPWYARVVAALALGYLFSPIDLIPDFIPVIGYLDDLLLIPLFILVARRLMPAEVLAEHREAARARAISGKPTNWIAAAVIVGVWLLLAVCAIVVMWRVVV